MISQCTFLLILFISFGLLSFYFLNTSFKSNRLDHIFVKILISSVISFFSIIIIFYIIRLFDSTTESTWVRSINVVSIKNSSEVSGSFTLGTGTVESIEYYYYYFPSGEGYKRGKKPVDKTLIIERSNEKPHLESQVKRFHSKTGLVKYEDERENSWKIIVPPGSIISKFEVY